MESDITAKAATTHCQEELVAGIRAGDERAWRAMTEQYKPLLLWVARRCGLSADDADDAVQFTWLRCLEHIDQLTDADRLNGWLATICRRECVRQAIKARREVLLSDPDMARLIDARYAERDPCTETALRDQYERLHRAVMDLPGRQRMILVELLKRGDQSYLDLSRRLGLPVGSIGPTRQRAVSRLRLDPRIADVSAQYPDPHPQAGSA
jgi:RNA polymerase sigma factor (sigma-70 family)